MKFFENVAHILCGGEKREYTQGKRGIQKIKQTQKNNVNNIITQLKNASRQPNLVNENSQIFIFDTSPDVDALGFSADVYYETATEIVAIELKSVKPNSGEMKGEKQKILEGKAALYQLSPNKTIRFFLGFPFDPTVDVANGESSTSYNKKRFFSTIIDINRFFAQDETLVACELWNFLSGGTNTMEDILHIINTIATPKFIDKFKILQDTTKRTNREYLKQLEEWYLFSEKELFDNNTFINSKLDNSNMRIFNNSSFSSNGEYNWNRYNELRKLF
jgi:hypothetical protein